MAVSSFLSSRHRSMALNRRALLLVAALVILVYAVLHFSQDAEQPKLTPHALVHSLAKRRLNEVDMYATAAAAADGVDVTPLPVHFNGSYWYRIGEPWKGYYVENVAFAFRIDNSRIINRVLLAFGQSLEGVFNPVKRSFFAVCVDKEGAVRISLQPQSRTAPPSSIVLPGSYSDGQWHAIAMALREDMVYVAMGNHSTRDEEGGGGVGSWDISVTEHKVAHAHRVHSNSGSYFGAVVGRWSLPEILRTPDVPDLLAGSVSHRVHVNGLSLGLREAAQSGLTEEEPAMRVLRAMQGGARDPNAGRGSWKTVMASEHSAALHFPVLTALTDKQVAVAADMIASARHHMPRRGVLVYSLLLGESNKRHLRTVCGVAVRDFPDLYASEDVGRAAVVQATVKEFGGALFADPWVRFQKDIMRLQRFLVGYGVVVFSAAAAAEDDDVVGGDSERGGQVARVPVVSGACQIFLDTPFVRQAVLRHWVSCTGSGNSAACPRPTMAHSGYKTEPSCEDAKRDARQLHWCHPASQRALTVALWMWRRLNHRLYSKLIMHRKTDSVFLLATRNTSDYPRCHRSPDGDGACRCHGKAPKPNSGVPEMI